MNDYGQDAALLDDDHSSAVGAKGIFVRDYSLLLRIATMNGHKDLVEFLLAKNADSNAVTNGGYTPLHCAAEQGS